MHRFKCFTPTKVVFGPGSEARVGARIRIKEQGGKKIFLHYGGGGVIGSAKVLYEADMLAIFRLAQ